MTELPYQTIKRAADELSALALQGGTHPILRTLLPPIASQLRAVLATLALHAESVDEVERRAVG